MIRICCPRNDQLGVNKTAVCERRYVEDLDARKTGKSCAGKQRPILIDKENNLCRLNACGQFIQGRQIIVPVGLNTRSCSIACPETSSMNRSMIPGCTHRSEKIRLRTIGKGDRALRGISAQEPRCSFLQPGKVLGKRAMIPIQQSRKVISSLRL